MFCRVAELGVLGSDQPAMDFGPVARFAVAAWVAPFNVCSYLIMSPVVMAWPEAELIEPLVHTPRQVGDRFDRLEESLAHARGGVAQDTEHPEAGWAPALGANLHESLGRQSRLEGRLGRPGPEDSGRLNWLLGTASKQVRRASIGACGESLGLAECYGFDPCRAG